MSRKKKKSSLSTLLLVLMLLAGLAVMLYPAFSDWWNSKVQSRAVASYEQAVAALDDSAYERMFEAAHRYNEQLARVSAPIANPEAVSGYDVIMDITGTGIMGYVTIPAVQIELPVYHGTEADVLNVAVGHIQGTSIPVGGESTHAVFSAHRGLPSARLFTDIDKLVVGDIFTVTVLKEIFTYEVEEIQVVLPHEIEALAIVPNADKITLMTCTPYGINTHRLLVRAHRVETEYARTVLIPADCVKLDSMLVIAVICVPLLIVLIVFWSRSSRGRDSAFPPAHLHSILSESHV